MFCFLLSETRYHLFLEPPSPSFFSLAIYFAFLLCFPSPFSRKTGKYLSAVFRLSCDQTLTSCISSLSRRTETGHPSSERYCQDLSNTLRGETIASETVELSAETSDLFKVKKMGQFLLLASWLASHLAPSPSLLRALKAISVSGTSSITSSVFESIFRLWKLVETLESGLPPF